MIVQVGIYSKLQLLKYERKYNIKISKIKNIRKSVSYLPTANDTDTPQTGNDKENRVKIRDAR